MLWHQIAPITISFTNESIALLLVSVLTPLLTADSIAKAGADHLLTTLTSEPTLSIVVGGSRVCAACSLNWLSKLLSSIDWSNHDSTRGCQQPNEVKIKSQLDKAFLFSTKSKFQVKILMYLCLRCASHTSIVHEHFLSTGTAGSVHLSQSFSTSRQSGRTFYLPCHCNGLNGPNGTKAVRRCVSSTLKQVYVWTGVLLLEVHVIRPFPSPRHVQSSIIQPWYGLSQVSPTT